MIEGKFNSMKHWRYELHVNARQSLTELTVICGVCNLLPICLVVLITNNVVMVWADKKCM